MTDYELFGGRCPYTDEECGLTIECVDCSVDREEKESMARLDKAASMTREEIDKYICKCPYFTGAECIDRSVLGTHIGSCKLEFHYKKICPSSKCICAKKFGLAESEEE